MPGQVPSLATPVKALPFDFSLLLIKVGSQLSIHARETNEAPMLELNKLHQEKQHRQRRDYQGQELQPIHRRLFATGTAYSPKSQNPAAVITGRNHWLTPLIAGSPSPLAMKCSSCLRSRARPRLSFTNGSAINQKLALPSSVVTKFLRATASSATGRKHSIPDSRERATIAAPPLWKIGTRKPPSSSR